MSESINRSEHDAKLSASEERMNSQITGLRADVNTKFCEIMSEIRAMRSDMDGRFAAVDGRFAAMDARLNAMNDKLNDYREDSRSGKWALWAIAITIIAATATPLIEKYLAWIK